MSSTNKTANYELSQFVGTDIPSILSDYNGDMRKIDAGIAEVASSAGSSASAVSALAGRVTTAENSITTLNGALEVTNQRSIQNQTAITAVQGVIPSDASTENKLATSEEVSDVADEVKGIADVVPSTASTSNQLVTRADIESAGHKILYAHDDGTTVTWGEILTGMFNALIPYKDDMSVILNAKIRVATSGLSEYQYAGIPSSISDTYIGEFDGLYAGGNSQNNTAFIEWGRITLQETPTSLQKENTTIASSGITVNSNQTVTTDTTSRYIYLYI